MSRAPADRVRTLLLKADNQMKHSSGARLGAARAALLEAREVAAGDGVDPRVRELVERRLAALPADPEAAA